MAILFDYKILAGIVVVGFLMSASGCETRESTDRRSTPGVDRGQLLRSGEWGQLLADDPCLDFLADSVAFVAIEWLARGELERAGALCTSFLQHVENDPNLVLSPPEEAALRRTRARALMQLEHFGAAKRDLSWIIEASKGQSSDFIDRAACAAQFNQRSAARNDISHVDADDTEESIDLVRRAFVYGFLGEHDKAERDLERALELFPKHPSARVLLVDLRIETGDLDSARTLAEDHTRLDDSTELDWQILASVYAIRGEFGEALAAAQRAVAMAPESPSARFDMAQVHVKMEEYARGIEGFERAERLAEEKGIHVWVVRSQFALAEVYRRIGQLVKAKDTVEKTLANYPNDPAARWYRALTFRAMGKYEEAWSDLEVFGQSESARDDMGFIFYEFRALVAFEMGREDLAREELLRADEMKWESDKLGPELAEIHDEAKALRIRLGLDQPPPP